MMTSLRYPLIVFGIFIYSLSLFLCLLHYKTIITLPPTLSPAALVFSATISGFFSILLITIKTYITRLNWFILTVAILYSIILNVFLLGSEYFPFMGSSIIPISFTLTTNALILFIFLVSKNEEIRSFTSRARWINYIAPVLTSTFLSLVLYSLYLQFNQTFSFIGKTSDIDFESRNYLLFIITSIIGVILALFHQRNVDMQLMTLDKSKKNISFIAVPLIILLGFILYAHGIGQYGFQVDEYFHAEVASNYLDGGKFLTLGDGSLYTRSPLTSFLPIASSWFFEATSIKATEMFIYRLPIVLFSLASILFVYLISRLYLPVFFSLATTLLFTLEIWFIYFAKYLRFYSPSLAVMLGVLYFSLKYPSSKRILFITLCASIAGYFLLTDYFLLIGLYILINLFIILYNEKKYLILITTAVASLMTVTYMYIDRLLFNTSNANPTVIYNSALLSWNPTNMLRQIDWLLINYPLYLSFFVIGLFLFIKRHRYLYLYITLNFAFFILYVNNAQYNFTFRPYYFFLPLLFISFTIVLTYVFGNNKKYVSLILVLMVGLSLYQTLNFSIAKPGDRYFPTKLVYEKADIVEGNYDVFTFLNKFLTEQEITDYEIIFLGGGSLYSYYGFQFDKIYGSATKDKREITLQNLDSDIRFADKKTFIIAPANIYANRINYLYSYLWQQRSITELSVPFSEYLESNPQIKLIYLSEDGNSKVFVTSHQ